jgi:hypothetical protein
MNGDYLSTKDFQKESDHESRNEFCCVGEPDILFV